MEDYRYRLIEIEAQFEQDDEDEDEQFDDDSSSFEDREREEHVIPLRIGSPVDDVAIFNDGELEDDDSSFDEHDEEDEEDYEEHEDDELLFPVVRRLHNDSIVDDDDDYEDDEEYGEEGEEEEDYEEEELDELFPVQVTSSRVSSEVFNGGMLLGGMVSENNGVVEDSDVSDGSELGEGKGGGQRKCGGESRGSVCPICFEAWTSGGDHQICCLPCGHIYGLSCIKKWLQQSRGSGKCPQCNNICTFKDVRVLYTSRLCVADEELQKRVRSLEAKCAYLEQKAGSLTTDELIDQICSNPAAVQRLATVLAGLHHQQPVSS
ncbi:hypothetical protein M8C21_029805 [Ambrosia artemisiifolia]|uniref:RING-type domain-containing protein n=1 Tax=Ambrosia artemisiifolia TaxID=4212 RepID=A0AAD5G1B3_AMBAR|nr:hypothetical protein M8C21_029805 [Ambrosia artemisiifolia]